MPNCIIIEPNLEQNVIGSNGEKRLFKNFKHEA